MQSLKQSLAFWSSILGIVLEFLGLTSSGKRLALVGTLLLAGSVAALLYAGQQRQRLKLAGIRIEGRAIDSLNVASLTRRVNRTLVIQESHQTATIKGEDMIVSWRYSGYCKVHREVAIEFSVDTDNHIPFNRLDCHAYDLRNDPQRLHPIRPVLLGSDGLSKKIAVPFLEPLSENDQFSVMLTCVLPGSMKGGVEYYTSTLSVDQASVPSSTVRIAFIGNRPEWLRVYECSASGEIRLVKDLRPSSDTKRRTEYFDIEENRPAQSALIYIFDRSVKWNSPAT